MPPLPVEIRTLQLHPVERVDEYVGTVKSRQSTIIQPQVEGYLQQILVKPGQRVSPGTPMFEIDSTTQQVGLSAVESVRAAREADAALAKQVADRTKALLTAGASSQQELDQAIAQQKAADAQLKAIEDQIRQMRAQLAYYRVTAATDGVVGDIPVRKGDLVTRQTALTSVETYAGLEVYINVPVQQAPNLKVGLPVRLVNDTGETLASETINFVSPSVDDTTQTVLAKTPLAAHGTLFRADQFVRVRILWSTAPGLTVPVVAVNRINGQYFAFVAEGAGDKLVAKQRSVTLGPVVANEYIVVAGLKEGDRLIVSGLQKIGDGAPVQPAPPGPPPGGGGEKGKS